MLTWCYCRSANCLQLMTNTTSYSCNKLLCTNMLVQECLTHRSSEIVSDISQYKLINTLTCLQCE